MSNYLFVAGNFQHVEKLKEYFEDELGSGYKDSSFQKISDEKSIFIVERRNDCVKSSIINQKSGESVFFRGQALDHETSSMILGINGFAHFQLKHNEYLDPNKIADFEGTFVLARWNEYKLTIQTDLYSIYRLIYFANDEIAIISDSLRLIVECMKVLDIERKPNGEVLTMKAWNASGLPNAPFSKELIVKGVYTLQVGKHLELNLSSNKLEPKCVERPVMSIFQSSSLSYEELLRDCAIKMYSSINFLIKSFNPAINFGLSGGIDSRLLLSLCLRSKEIMDLVIVNTNTNPGKSNDFDVVEALSKKYGFRFNDVKHKNQVLENIDSKRIKIENKYGFWILGSLGIYDSFYFTPYYYDYPSVLSMTGVGAEPVKQTMDKGRISNVARSQHPAIRDMIRRKISETVSSMGIDPDSDGAMKWYHMTHKAAHHLGFKTGQSSMLLRPYVQKSIFSIALHPNNPFKGRENKGPTVLHDLIILLNHELASEEYDSEEKNISMEYARTRLEELGGPIDLTICSEPSIFGDVRQIANGPATPFLNLVKDYSIPQDEDLRDFLKKKVIENHTNKLPHEFKEIYHSCYQNTLNNLDNEHVLLSHAGALAARFIVFDLFDQ